MKSIVITGVFLAACAIVYADSDVSADALSAEGLAVLQQFDENTKTLSGRFTQTVSGQSGAPEVSEGTFRLERPGRFVWTYETPDEQIIVADGENLWNYDVLLDQVNVRAQEEALADSPATILSGGKDPLDAFDYHGSFERESVLWVQLQPRTEESDFGVLRIGFRDGILAGMQLGDNLDQVTWIEFSDVEQNPILDDSTFRFTPPAGVDVYGTPAGSSSGAVNPESTDDVAAPTPVVEGLG